MDLQVNAKVIGGEGVACILKQFLVYLNLLIFVVTADPAVLLLVIYSIPVD